MGLFDSSDSSAQDYLKKALDAYQQINVPTLASETVDNLPMETVQGTVNPAAIQVNTQEPSAFNNIALDPATRAAQMAALSQYTDIANGGGLDAEAKLALQQTIDAANIQAQGERGALQRQAQAEGQSGGDFSLVQQAIANQGASNTAATQGLQTAAMAEANREAALNNMANIGGSINAADYNQAATKAAAQNQINATDQAALNAANTGNVANTIQTGEFNTNTAQGVNAANTGAGQNKVYYNAALPQQQFNNELNKAAGIAGVSGAQANTAQNAQNAGLGFAGSLLGTAGTIGGAMLGGPAGAAIGGTLANSFKPGATASSAPIGGGRSTPTGGNANPANYGMADGGYVCYADGGVAHDHAICAKLGAHIVARTPDEKAVVPGNSASNDRIPAMLSEDELVIPRDVPKTGPAMEAFAKNAPINGDTRKKVDLTTFTAKYKRAN